MAPFCVHIIRDLFGLKDVLCNLGISLPLSELSELSYCPHYWWHWMRTVTTPTHDTLHSRSRRLLYCLGPVCLLLRPHSAHSTKGRADRRQAALHCSDATFCLITWGRTLLSVLAKHGLFWVSSVRSVTCVCILVLAAGKNGKIRQWECVEDSMSSDETDKQLW